MEEKIKQIEALLNLFKLERYAYLITLVVCAILLMGIAVFMLLKEKIDIIYFVGLLTPSGAMIYMVKDMLKMWNDVLSILNRNDNGNS